MKENQKLSVAAIVTSMVIFGTIGIFRRYIPLPSETLAFARGVMGSVFLLIVLKVTGRPFDIRSAGKYKWLLALTGAMIGLNWILLFEAYNYTSVAVATLCYYMQPVIVILVSPLLLKERFTVRKCICVIVSLTGMVFVSGILNDAGQNTGSFRGILLGLGAAALYACVVLLNKKITGVPVYEKTIIQLSCAAIVMIPYMIAAGTLKNYHLEPGQTAALITVGILHTGIAYAIYFGAIEHLPAQTAALLSYIDPVTAVLLSAGLLREPLTGLTVLGAVLILGSAMASEMTGRGS
ncbi:MAG: DMT family transporter [Lachnospiraceae bacterium]|nr:DMT family transporter [Lachnospiraceae bacterium]